MCRQLGWLCPQQSLSPRSMQRRTPLLHHRRARLDGPHAYRSECVSRGCGLGATPVWNQAHLPAVAGRTIASTCRASHRGRLPWRLKSHSLASPSQTARPTRDVGARRHSAESAWRSASPAIGEDRGRVSCGADAAALRRSSWQTMATLRPAAAAGDCSADAAHVTTGRCWPPTRLPATRRGRSRA